MLGFVKMNLVDSTKVEPILRALSRSFLSLGDRNSPSSLALGFVGSFEELWVTGNVSGSKNKARMGNKSSRPTEMMLGIHGLVIIIQADNGVEMISATRIAEYMKKNAFALWRSFVRTGNACTHGVQGLPVLFIQNVSDDCIDHRSRYLRPAAKDLNNWCYPYQSQREKLREPTCRGQYTWRDSRFVHERAAQHTDQLSNGLLHRYPDYTEDEDRFTANPICENTPGHREKNAWTGKG